MKHTFTDLKLRAIQPPLKGQTDYFDTLLGGFGLRVSQGGTKTFFLKHRDRRITIGRFPILSLSQARQEAKKQLAEFTLGRFRSRGLNYEETVSLYLNEKQKNRRPSTIAEYRRLLNRVTFSRIDEITHDNIVRQLKPISSKYEYNKVLVAVRIFCNWLVKRRLMEYNPTAAITVHKTNSRSRVLSAEEIKKLWDACRDETNDLSPQFRKILMLLVLLGQRRGEIAALRTSFIDGDVCTFPASLCKNNREHCFPLPPLALEIIRDIQVDRNDAFFFPSRVKNSKGHFNAWPKNKAKLDRICGIALFRIHDIRRTFRTIHARIKTPSHIAERLVNHVSSRSAMEETYDRHNYLPEMRVAVENYAKFLQSIHVG